MIIRLLVDIPESAMTLETIQAVCAQRPAVRVMGTSEDPDAPLTIGGIVTGRIVGAIQVHGEGG